MPRTLINSSYRFNTTDFTLSQCHPQTLNMKSCQNLSPPSNLLGVAVWSISILRHKTSIPYNSNIQSPIYTKFLRHVEGVTLNTSMHQYCVISIAPPAGHRKSEKHHPINMTFTGEHALRRAWTVRAHSSLLAALIYIYIKYINI